jgi:hypothetical protein
MSMGQTCYWSLRGTAFDRKMGGQDGPGQVLAGWTGQIGSGGAMAWREERVVPRVRVVAGGLQHGGQVVDGVSEVDGPKEQGAVSKALFRRVLEIKVRCVRQAVSSEGNDYGAEHVSEKERGWPGVAKAVRGPGRERGL